MTLVNRINEKLKAYKRLNQDILYDSESWFYCGVCSIKINHTRKSLVVQHFSTNLHKKTIYNIQHTTYNFIVNRLKLLKKKDIDIWFEGFTEPNISLHKSRNPVIINMFQELSINPPSDSSLRNKIYSFYKDFIGLIKSIFKNKKFFDDWQKPKKW